MVSHLQPELAHHRSDTAQRQLRAPPVCELWLKAGGHEPLCSSTRCIDSTRSRCRITKYESHFAFAAYFWGVVCRREPFLPHEKMATWDQSVHAANPCGIDRAPPLPRERVAEPTSPSPRCISLPLPRGQSSLISLVLFEHSCDLLGTQVTITGDMFPCEKLPFEFIELRRVTEYYLLV